MRSLQYLGLAALLLVVSAGCTNPADTSPVDAGVPVETPTVMDGQGGGSGGSGGGSDGGSGGGGSGGGSASGSGGGGGGGVVGSPIRMPGFQQTGRPMVEVYPDFVRDLIEACESDDLCVEIEVRSADGKGRESTCGFLRTLPTEGALVKRGSTVVFITGSSSCTETDENSESTDGTDGEGTGTDGESTDGSENGTDGGTDGEGTGGTETELPPTEGTEPSTPPESPTS